VVCAPAGIAPFARHGNDVVVVWDAASDSLDAYLAAGLSLARALCTRATMSRDEQSEDVTTMEKAIREVQKQAEQLEGITTSVGTIEKAALSITERVRIARKTLMEQVLRLDSTLEHLKSAAGPASEDV
jgi:hypothetical protein